MPSSVSKLNWPTCRKCKSIVFLQVLIAGFAVPRSYWSSASRFNVDTGLEKDSCAIRQGALVAAGLTVREILSLGVAHPTRLPPRERVATHGRRRRFRFPRPPPRAVVRTKFVPPPAAASPRDGATLADRVSSWHPFRPPPVAWQRTPEVSGTVCVVGLVLTPVVCPLSVLRTSRSMDVATSLTCHGHVPLRR